MWKIAAVPVRPMRRIPRSWPLEADTLMLEKDARSLLKRQASLLLLAMISLLLGCSTLTARWSPPEVELLGFEARLLNLDRQTFLVNLRLTNPNDRALPVKRLSYRLLLEGRQIAEGETALDRLIGAGSSELADLTVKTSLLELVPDLPLLLVTKDRLAWSVSGVAYADIGGVALPLPYRRSGMIAPADLLAGR